MDDKKSLDVLEEELNAAESLERELLEVSIGHLRAPPMHAMTPVLSQ